MGYKETSEALAKDLSQARWVARPQDIDRPEGDWMVVEDYFGEFRLVARGIGRTEAEFIAHHDPATVIAVLVEGED